MKTPLNARIVALKIGESITIPASEERFVNVQIAASHFARGRNRRYTVELVDEDALVCRLPDPEPRPKGAGKRVPLLAILSTMPVGTTLIVEGAESSIRATASKLATGEGLHFSCKRIQGQLNAMQVTRCEPVGEATETDFSKVASPLPRMAPGEKLVIPAPVDVSKLRNQANYWGGRLRTKFSVRAKADMSAIVTRQPDAPGDSTSPMFAFNASAPLAAYAFEKLAPGEHITVSEQHVTTHQILARTVRDRCAHTCDIGLLPSGDYWVKRVA